MEWISVNDKLPKKKDKYIVCLINGYPILCDVHDANFNLTTSSLSFYWPTEEWIKDRCLGEVTHWIPLPEPPKELK